MDTIGQLPGIGPKTLAKLHLSKIDTITDLFRHFPHRYIDFSITKPISELQENDQATISGQVIHFQNIFTRSHKNIQKATVADSTGKIDLIWFNQPYLSQTMKEGTSHQFAGTISRYLNKLTIIAPLSGDHQTGKILPVYPETSQLKSGWFRKTIHTHLPSFISGITDPLPTTVINQFKLLDLPSSYREIHSPTDQHRLQQAIYRLSLDEIISLQATSYLQKKHFQSQSPRFHLTTNRNIENKLARFLKSLPFTLTPSQTSAWTSIKSQLLENQPLNQLLQGDVGSGKTIIAILCSYLTYLNQATALIIAPTEILAQQHYATFKKLLPRLNLKLMTSSHPLKTTELSKKSIIIATHAAIFHQKMLQPQVGLLVIDEQHKFGVHQRSILTSGIHPPHCLTMTATPIPRTISLTLLGHLGLTTLHQSPFNRQSVKTFLVPNQKQAKCYQWLNQHLNQTHQQAFIVCPFIEESETLSSVKSAKTEFEALKQIFPDKTLELIHGKTPLPARQQILTKFSKNEINILVTTPIIEVGIDFPNATVIIIMSADRFGLAQLHQLRGRVGRNQLTSYCYLFTESKQDEAIKRLKFLETHSDGQKIAEFDLSLRGPGETFSTIQHGFPSLKLASLSNYELICLGQKVIDQLLAKHFDLRQLTSHHSSELSATN